MRQSGINIDAWPEDVHVISGPGFLDRNTGYGIAFPRGYIRFVGTIKLTGTPVRRIDALVHGVSPDNPDNREAIQSAWSAACEVYDRA